MITNALRSSVFGILSPCRRRALRRGPLFVRPSPAIAVNNARYPIRWRIRIPGLNLELQCDAAIPQQELSAQDNSTASYWEGAVTYSGSVSGVGYLEMTGYAGKVQL